MGDGVRLAVNLVHLVCVGGNCVYDHIAIFYFCFPDDFLLDINESMFFASKFFSCRVLIQCLYEIGEDITPYSFDRLRVALSCEPLRQLSDQSVFLI